MFSALIESQIFQFFYGQFARIASECLIERASYGDMGIAFRTSHIFVIQRLAHESSDMRKPSIRKRKLSDLIRVGDTDYLFQ